MRSGESSFVMGLEGSEIVTAAQLDLDLPERTWIITTKLGEVSRSMHKTDREDIGIGHAFEHSVCPGFTAAKFLCYLKGDESYLGIHQPSYVFTIRYQSLARNGVHHKDELNSTVVPQLLGYNHSQQLDTGIIPEGFETAFVWKKVPGVPLTDEYFWGLDRPQRDIIRDEFRNSYEKLGRCGFQPFTATLSKLIYDESTGGLHISGFRMAVPVQRPYKWSSTKYVAYRLAKAPRRADWFEHEDEWEY
ncbi:hypothetical protein N7540_002589 [Penicillium herquei]|nr:hypothetical protein N7540_002589 [Penicillium herquei]